MLSARQQLANAIRAEALALCGGRCQTCSTTTDLQFHVLFDDHGAHHSFGSIKRQRFYLACVKGGDALLLCRKCHVLAEKAKVAQWPPSRRAREATGPVVFHGVTVLPISLPFFPED